MIRHTLIIVAHSGTPELIPGNPRHYAQRTTPHGDSVGKRGVPRRFWPGSFPAAVYEYCHLQPNAFPAAGSNDFDVDYHSTPSDYRGRAGVT